MCRLVCIITVIYIVCVYQLLFVYLYFIVFSLAMEVEIFHSCLCSTRETATIPYIGSLFELPYFVIVVSPVHVVIIFFMYNVMYADWNICRCSFCESLSLVESLDCCPASVVHLWVFLTGVVCCALSPPAWLFIEPLNVIKGETTATLVTQIPIVYSAPKQMAVLK